MVLGEFEIIGFMIRKLKQLYYSFRNKFHKRTVLKNKNIKIGANTILYYKSTVLNLSKDGKVNIGDNCLIGRSKTGYHAGMPFYTTILNDGAHSDVCIGNNCRINGAYIHAKESIQIGDNCVIASGVNIIDSNGHETYSLDRTVGRDTPRSITIGKNVWIGLNATILKGTIIGDNCVVSAGSIVKGEFPCNSIITGNPAKIVKQIEF